MGDLQDIQNILLIYEHASGQQINRDKTTVFFSKAILLEIKVAIQISFWGRQKLENMNATLVSPQWWVEIIKAV